MTKTVIVIESPNKVKSIINIIQNNASLWSSFGISGTKDLKVVSTKGHFMALNYNNAGKKGFLVTANNEVKPLYGFIDATRKREIIETIQKPIKEATNIFIATDNDNEGELIGNEVLSLLPANEWQNKNFNRIRITEITPSGVQRAIRNKEPYLNNAMVNSAIGRGIWDLEFGFTLSTLLREELKKKPTGQSNLNRSINTVVPSYVPTVTNAFLLNYKDQLKHLGSGRVKSYILEEIGNRCKSIKEYIEKMWYTLNPLVNGTIFTHTTSALPYAETKNENGSGNVIFPSTELATRAINELGKQVVCSKVSDVRHTISKLAEPLTLSDVPFSMLSNGINTQVDVSQLLFEAGLTTYPRSPYKTISKDFIEKALPEWRQFLINTQYPKIKDLDKQVWAIMPDNKFIAGTPENQEYLKKQEKKNKKTAKTNPNANNQEKDNGEPENAHECYRVTDILLDNAGMLLKCIEHKTRTGAKDYENVKGIIEQETDFINTNDNIYSLISKYSAYSKQLVFLNDCLKFYAEIRNGTRKVFTNPPEYDKADITLTSSNSIGDTFNASISAKTIIGYDYVKTIIKNNNLDDVQEDEQTQASSQSQGLQITSLASVLARFEVNKTYLITNFDVQDVNNPNSIIKKRTTTKPHLLTEQEVINLLKKNNIGTEATRAGTLKLMGLDIRGVLQRKKSPRGFELDLSDFGWVVWNETRTLCPDIVKKEWTAKLDERLNDIENEIYTKDELILELLQEMSKPPYAEYNWYTWQANNQSRMPSQQKTTSANICIFCNTNMTETEIRVFCENMNCPSYNVEIYNKYHQCWGWNKNAVITGQFCPNHPTIPMCKGSKGVYCPADMQIIMDKTGKLASFKQSIPPAYKESGILCPSCNAMMLQNAKTIACKNKDCPLGYNETYKCSWLILINNIVPNKFCTNHPRIPMCTHPKINKGQPYCPYEFVLSKQEKQ